MDKVGSHGGTGICGRWREAESASWWFQHMVSILQLWTSTRGWVKILYVPCTHQQHSSTMRHQGTIKFWGSWQQMTYPQNFRCNPENTLCLLRWRQTEQAPFISQTQTAWSSQGLIYAEVDQFLAFPSKLLQPWVQTWDSGSTLCCLSTLWSLQYLGRKLLIMQKRERGCCMPNV